MFFDTRTGKKCRGFPSWLTFKWSSDGKYFARIGMNMISLFETPSFGLLDKKSLKVDGVADFEWSPKDNILSYWTPQKDDTPARVSIVEVPSRREIRVKNLYNIHDLKMLWQKNGDYLCVMVQRGVRNKPQKNFSLELFRVHEKEIPVDTIEIKDTVITFAWEPTGHRFIVIHGEFPKVNVSFYKIEKKTLGLVTLLKTMEKKNLNHASWSPSGQFVVLAGLRTSDGILEFWDTSDMTLMANVKHSYVQNVFWDPSGRFVTSCMATGSQMDTEYYIWSSQGRILQKQSTDGLYQLQWRPRPPTLLSEEDIERIKKDLKKYQKEFEVKDKMNQMKASKEIIEKRQQMYKEFTDIRGRHKEVTELILQNRRNLGYAMDSELVEGIVEHLVGETITVVDG